MSGLLTLPNLYHGLPNTVADLPGVKLLPDGLLGSVG